MTPTDDDQRPVSPAPPVTPVSPAPPLPGSPPSRYMLWCLKALAAVPVMGLGAIYGVVAYRAFASLWTDASRGSSGQMLVSFVVGVPIVIGLLVGYIAHRKKIAGVASAALLSTLSICLFVFAAGALLREGMICIVMATPIFVVLAALGGMLGAAASAINKSRGPKLMSLALVLPLVLPLVVAPLEDEMPSATARQDTRVSIHIAAPPDVIWRHLNHPLAIRPAELEGGWAYRIGVPYPIEARTLQAGVGGTRSLRWQRGVQFTELITAWDLNRHIAWTYRFAPDSFPPGSLDDHIVIGGRYFNLERTAYTLAPEGDGTRLSIDVGTSVTTHFNRYAGWWASFLIDDTAQAILRFYKRRAEAEAIAASGAVTAAR